MTIPLISIKNLVVTIADKKLVHEVDFSIHQYDRIILVGENGSGKSTLLKIIKGITEPEKGVIWKKPNIKIEYLEQNPIFPLVDNMMDFLSFGLQHPNISKINEIIEELSLQNIDFSQKLSGGEIRKIFIAKAFLKEPDVILLDEPTNHIDLPTIFWLENKLLNLNTTMILISHDHDFLNKIGNKTYWLHNGKLRKRDGEYKGFFEWSESLMEIDKNQNHKIKQKIKSETKWSVEGISGRRKRNMGRVKELEKLPLIIREALESKVSIQDVVNYISKIESNSFDLDQTELSLKICNNFYYDGFLFDVKISESKMKEFLEENKNILKNLAEEFDKKLSE